MEVIHKIGRRKTSVARVYMSEGKGNIMGIIWPIFSSNKMPSRFENILSWISD